MKTHKMVIWDRRKGGTGYYGCEREEKIKKANVNTPA